MIRLSPIALMLSLCIGISLPGVVAADLSDCKRLYENYPGSLDGVALVDGRNLEKKTRGAGYGLFYGKVGQDRISLYFYDGGNSRVTPELARLELGQTGMVIMTLANVTGEVDLTEAYNFPRGAVAAIVVHLPATRQSSGDEYALIGIVDDCMYKLRYSGAGSVTRTKAKFKRIAQDFARHLN